MDKNSQDDFSMKTFLEQIDKIKEEFGLKKDRDFDRAMGLTNKLYRWRTDRDKAVNLETLLLIRKKFHKSIDWLLFGEEPSEVRPMPPMKADLLNQTLTLVEEVLKEQKKSLRLEQKTKLITRVYNDCAEDRIKPDSIMVKRYLWILD